MTVDPMIDAAMFDAVQAALKAKTLKQCLHSCFGGMTLRTGNRHRQLIERPLCAAFVIFGFGMNSAA